MPNYKALYEESVKQLDVAKRFLYELAAEAMEVYHSIEELEKNTEQIHMESRGGTAVRLAPPRKARGQRKGPPGGKP